MDGRDNPRPHWDGKVRPGSGGYDHEIIIRLRRALGYRCPVNRVAEQPERYGNVKNRNGLRHPASQRHGRSAETSGKAATAGGNATRVRSGGTPSGPDTAIHSNGDWDAVGCAGSCHGEACRLEREASSCNDGCELSFRRGKDPWVGCSELAGYYSVFSATCKDTLTHTDYVQCTETKMFLGWDRQRSWWYCTGMLAGGKFRVTAENRNR